jgi:hypothetical protein
MSAQHAAPGQADVLATWLLLHGVGHVSADGLAEALLEWFNVTPRHSDGTECANP